MRVTADVDKEIYEHVKQRARTRGVAMGSLLGELIAKGLEADPVRTMPSGRFTVIAPPNSEWQVASAQIQQIIDSDGYL